MYIQQADLFWGMNKGFVKEIMDIAEKETCQKGDFLFREGDPAIYFYILIKGQVKLIVGETGPMVHTVDHAGNHHQDPHTRGSTRPTGLPPESQIDSRKSLPQERKG